MFQGKCGKPRRHRLTIDLASIAFECVVNLKSIQHHFIIIFQVRPPVQMLAPPFVNTCGCDHAIREYSFISQFQFRILFVMNDSPVLRAVGQVRAVAPDRSSHKRLRSRNTFVGRSISIPAPAIRYTLLPERISSLTCQLHTSAEQPLALCGFDASGREALESGLEEKEQRRDLVNMWICTCRKMYSCVLRVLETCRKSVSPTTLSPVASYVFPGSQPGRMRK